MVPLSSLCHSMPVHVPARRERRSRKPYHRLEDSYGTGRKPGSQGAPANECALLAVVVIVFLALLMVLADVVSIT